MAAVETIAAKQSREDCEYRLLLDKTTGAALTAEEKTEKRILESPYMILSDISNLDDKIERTEHNVNCLAALLSVCISELDPAAFKKGT